MHNECPTIYAYSAAAVVENTQRILSHIAREAKWNIDEGNSDLNARMVDFQINAWFECKNRWNEKSWTYRMILIGYIIM